MVIAVYPGTFDPLTRGHEDLVRRASSLFSKLIVGVADSKNKSPFFSLDERLSIDAAVAVPLERAGLANRRGGARFLLTFTTRLLPWRS